MGSTRLLAFLSGLVACAALAGAPAAVAAPTNGGAAFAGDTTGPAAGTTASGASYDGGAFSPAGGASPDPAVAPAPSGGRRPNTGGAVPTPPRRRGARHLGDRPLRAGLHGADVSELQRALTGVGYRVATTGYFGGATRRALLRFQRARHLTPNGTAGADTVAALRAPAPDPVAAPIPAPALPSARDHASSTGWAFPISPRSAAAAPRTWTEDQGVDIATLGRACGPDAVLVAVDDGTVVAEGIAGFGSQAPILRLDHGPYAGRFVYYGHSQPALVGVGTHVRRGQPIAQVGCGRVGLSSGPHLEIGISLAGGPPCCPHMGATAPLMDTIMRSLFAG